ncbi:hypothetical protein ACKVMT_10050 [Halobacteriales archaeon Cl-PHB]
MTLDTNGDVEEIQKVQAADGTKRPPSDGDAQGNWDTLAGDSHSTSGTTEESLPSNAVPDGATVMLHPQSGNADTVLVGPAGHATYPLSATADTYEAQVSNTDQIAVKASTSGDGVAIHWEADN